jgi:trk system potassium uptake protein TrkH
MFLAGTNMSIIYFGLKRNFSKITGNNEFIFYLITCLLFVIGSSTLLWLTRGFSPGKAAIEGSFQVISIITTTGYYHIDYNLWGNLLILIIFLLMFTGGTSGSASSGLKIIRLLLITRNTRNEMRRMIHPFAVIPVRLDSNIVHQGIINNLLVFITLYFVVICVSSFGISLMGYDMITSFSTAASMLGNIGPGIGEFGPFSDYASVPMAGKWFLSLLMLTGRLELFSILIFLTPGFYRS